MKIKTSAIAGIIIFLVLLGIVLYINRQINFMPVERCDKCSELDSLDGKGYVHYYKGIVTINGNKAIYIKEQHSGRVI